MSKFRASWVLVSILVLSMGQTAAAQAVTPPEWSDAVSLGGWWEDQVTDIAVDPNTGDIIVVGNFLYDLHLGPYVLSSVPGLSPWENTSDIFVAKLSGSQWKWAVSAGGGDYDWVNSVAIDSNGDAYVAGGFMSNNSSFDPFTLTNADQTPRVGLQTQPTSDGFVAKISKDGYWLWAESISGLHSDEVSGVCVGPDDKVVAVGSFMSSTIQFGGSSSNLSNPPKSMSNSGLNGTKDVFAIKFDSNASYVWHAQIMGLGNEEVYGVAIHEYGDVMLTGYFTEQAAYFLPHKAINTKSGTSEAFVARLSPHGLWSWVSVAGGERGEEGYDLDVDSSGMTYVIGRFNSDSLGFRDPSNHTVTRLGNTVQVGSASVMPASTDVFVAKLDGNGKWLWVRGIEGDGTDDAGGITVVEECAPLEQDEDVITGGSGCVTGAVVAGGFYSLNYTFGHTTLWHSTAFNHQDMFVAGISENGTWQWAISGGMAKWPEYFVVDNHKGVIHIASSFSVGKATLGEHALHNWDENSTYQWPDGFVASLEYRPLPPRMGCTDSTALNWDPQAQVDNGSCQYPPDNDGDGIDDEADSDDDNDGFDDITETVCGSDPLDSNSQPSDWDSDGFCDSLDGDDDNDGLLDEEELDNGTDPLDPDSDDDGFNDEQEVQAGTDPMNPEDYPQTECCTPSSSPLEKALPVILLVLILLLFLIRRNQEEND